MLIFLLFYKMLDQNFLNLNKNKKIYLKIKSNKLNKKLENYK